MELTRILTEHDHLESPDFSESENLEATVFDIIELDSCVRGLADQIGIASRRDIIDEAKKYRNDINEVRDRLEKIKETCVSEVKEGEKEDTRRAWKNARKYIESLDAIITELISGRFR